ncbi:hypothetical protein AVEN_86773-1 [Araneus ventricosus]|uniref:Uncharacterized protein n=1 Tax=Araneus ventricosus TaxID=182803 RepID=A0A4Y2TMK8_ARAVE|nr:hypothetical protein AVEN_86773-1 [Araneus ventricosus]
MNKSGMVIRQTKFDVIIGLVIFTISWAMDGECTPQNHASKNLMNCEIRVEFVRGTLESAYRCQVASLELKKISGFVEESKEKTSHFFPAAAQ